MSSDSNLLHKINPFRRKSKDQTQKEPLQQGDDNNTNEDAVDEVLQEGRKFFQLHRKAPEPPTGSSSTTADKSQKTIKVKHKPEEVITETSVGRVITTPPNVHHQPMGRKVPPSGEDLQEGGGAHDTLPVINAESEGSLHYDDLAGSRPESNLDTNREVEGHINQMQAETNANLKSVKAAPDPLLKPTTGLNTRDFATTGSSPQNFDGSENQNPELSDIDNQMKQHEEIRKRLGEDPANASVLTAHDASIETPRYHEGGSDVDVGAGGTDISGNVPSSPTATKNISGTGGVGVGTGSNTGSGTATPVGMLSTAAGYLGFGKKPHHHDDQPTTTSHDESLIKGAQKVSPDIAKLPPHQGEVGVTGSTTADQPPRVASEDVAKDAEGAEFKETSRFKKTEDDVAKFNIEHGHAHEKKSLLEIAESSGGNAGGELPSHSEVADALVGGRGDMDIQGSGGLDAEGRGLNVEGDGIKGKDLDADLGMKKPNADLGIDMKDVDMNKNMDANMNRDMGMNLGDVNLPKGANVNKDINANANMDKDMGMNLEGSKPGYDSKIDKGMAGVGAGIAAAGIGAGIAGTDWDKGKKKDSNMDKDINLNAPDASLDKKDANMNFGKLEPDMDTKLQVGGKGGDVSQPDLNMNKDISANANVDTGVNLKGTKPDSDSKIDKGMAGVGAGIAAAGIGAGVAGMHLSKGKDKDINADKDINLEGPDASLDKKDANMNLGKLEPDVDTKLQVGGKGGDVSQPELKSRDISAGEKLDKNIDESNVSGDVDRSVGVSGGVERPKSASREGSKKGLFSKIGDVLHLRRSSTDESKNVKKPDVDLGAEGNINPDAQVDAKGIDKPDIDMNAKEMGKPDLDVNAKGIDKPGMDIDAGEHLPKGMMHDEELSKDLYEPMDTTKGSLLKMLPPKSHVPIVSSEISTQTPTGAQLPTSDANAKKDFDMPEMGGKMSAAGTQHEEHLKGMKEDFDNAQERLGTHGDTGIDKGTAAIAAGTAGLVALGAMEAKDKKAEGLNAEVKDKGIDKDIGTSGMDAGISKKDFEAGTNANIDKETAAIAAGTAGLVGLGAMEAKDKRSEGLNADVKDKGIEKEMGTDIPNKDMKLDANAGDLNLKDTDMPSDHSKKKSSSPSEEHRRISLFGSGSKDKSGSPKKGIFGASLFRKKSPSKKEVPKESISDKAANVDVTAPMANKPESDKLDMTAPGDVEHESKLEVDKELKDLETKVGMGVHHAADTSEKGKQLEPELDVTGENLSKNIDEPINECDISGEPKLREGVEIPEGGKLDMPSGDAKTSGLMDHQKEVGTGGKPELSLAEAGGLAGAAAAAGGALAYGAMKPDKDLDIEKDVNAPSKDMNIDKDMSVPSEDIKAGGSVSAKTPEGSKAQDMTTSKSGSKKGIFSGGIFHSRKKSKDKVPTSKKESDIKSPTVMKEGDVKTPTFEKEGNMKESLIDKLPTEVAGALGTTHISKPEDEVNVPDVDKELPEADADIIGSSELGARDRSMERGSKNAWPEYSSEKGNHNEAKIAAGIGGATVLTAAALHGAKKKDVEGAQGEQLGVEQDKSRRISDTQEATPSGKQEIQAAKGKRHSWSGPSKGIFGSISLGKHKKSFEHKPASKDTIETSGEGIEKAKLPQSKDVSTKDEALLAGVGAIALGDKAMDIPVDKMKSSKDMEGVHDERMLQAGGVGTSDTTDMRKNVPGAEFNVTKPLGDSELGDTDKDVDYEESSHIRPADKLFAAKSLDPKLMKKDTGDLSKEISGSTQGKERSLDMGGSGFDQPQGMDKVNLGTGLTAQVPGYELGSQEEKDFMSGKDTSTRDMGTTGDAVVDVIGIQDRGEAFKTAQSVSKKLDEQGVDLSAGKLVIDMNKQKIYKPDVDQPDMTTRDMGGSKDLGGTVSGGPSEGAPLPTGDKPLSHKVGGAEAAMAAGLAGVGAAGVASSLHQRRKHRLPENDNEEDIYVNVKGVHDSEFATSLARKVVFRLQKTHSYELDNLTEIQVDATTGDVLDPQGKEIVRYPDLATVQLPGRRGSIQDFAKSTIESSADITKPVLAGVSDSALDLEGEPIKSTEMHAGSSEPIGAVAGAGMSRGLQMEEEEDHGYSSSESGTSVEKPAARFRHLLNEGANYTSDSLGNTIIKGPPTLVSGDEYLTPRSVALPKVESQKTTLQGDLKSSSGIYAGDAKGEGEGYAMPGSWE